VTCRPSQEPGNGIPGAGRDPHVQPAAGLQEGASSLLFANYIANTDKVKDSHAKQNIKLQVKGILRFLRNFDLGRNYPSIIRYYLTQKKCHRKVVF